MSLEDSLIQLAVTGDREAQRLVYESLRDSIGRLVSRIVDASDVDELSAQYNGTLVSLDAAKELLGYELVAAKLPSAGYRVASTHVLKMPCCKCPASLCVREDGSEFLLFEHNEEQLMWFGDSPTISAQCCGKVCHCAQMPDQLAVTWKVGTRYVTAVGVNGLEEITNLMAVVDPPNSAG